MEEHRVAADMTVGQRRMLAYCMTAWETAEKKRTFDYEDRRVRVDVEFAVKGERPLESAKKNGGIALLRLPEERGHEAIFRAHFIGMGTVTSAEDMSGENLIHITFGYGPHRPDVKMSAEQEKLLSICRRAAKLQEGQSHPEYMEDGIVLDALRWGSERRGEERTLHWVALTIRGTGREICKLSFCGGRAVKFDDELLDESFSLSVANPAGGASGQARV